MHTTQNILDYEHLKNITILYCEDEIELRELTTELLSNYTKKVYCSNNGQEALEIYKKYSNEIDLIITDIYMPGMNGLDMAKEIKKLNNNIPIIVATAFDNSKYLLEAIDLGIDKYILKPIDIRKLFHIIGQSLMYHELRYLYKDTLTLLPNRNSLIKNLKNLKEARISMFDISQFSILNELYGDTIGDQILISFSNIINKSFANLEHILYRVGDDKFVLCTNYECISQEELHNQCQKFLNSFESSGLKVQGQNINFNVTIAISSSNYLDTYTSALRVLSLAKQQYVQLLVYDKTIHSTNADEFKENYNWIQTLKNGLHDGSFRAYYQSIVDVKTKKVYKYESLIRYIGKNGIAVPPYKFLPIAKKARLYSGIVKLMINECINFIKEKRIIVSLNVSFDDIKTKATYDYIIKILEENKKITHYLHFEILESEEIEDFTLVKSFIDKVRKYGCQVGVDDFGSGYSNFNMLGELEFDFVKIDGSLIKEIATNKNQEVIVDVISNYTKRMNFKTIAEFVYSDEVYKKIKNLDINYAQGYLFSQPQPLNKIPKY